MLARLKFTSPRDSCWTPLLVLLVVKSAAFGAGVPACPKTRPVHLLDKALLHASSKLKTARALTIVAIGSSSTVGVGGSKPGGYAAEIETSLTALLPGTAVQVLNKGVSGESMRQMLRRFDRDVLAFHPDVVIWQLGTNAVLTERGVEQDASLVREGVERLKAADADVILMTPQFAPVVIQDPDCEPMLRLLDDVALLEHVAVFHRFDIMRGWVVAGEVELPALISADGLHMRDLGYRCLGDLLASAILEAMQDPTAQAQLSR